MSYLVDRFERGGVLWSPVLLLSILARWIFLDYLHRLKRAHKRAQSLFDEMTYHGRLREGLVATDGCYDLLVARLPIWCLPDPVRKAEDARLHGQLPFFGEP